MFPHKLHKVVRNDRWPPTALIMHMLKTCFKLSIPATAATHHLLVLDFRPIILGQLTIHIDWRYALRIKKLYHSPHFTVGGSWNKNLQLQLLQRCYCENLGSPTSACVMKCHY